MEKTRDMPEGRGDFDAESETGLDKIDPRINLKIFFSPHITARDFDGFEGELAGADVYAPEFPGWDKNYADFCENISQGRINPSHEELLSAIKNEGVVATLEKLYNTKKHIIFLDLPEGAPLLGKFKKLFASEGESIDLFEKDKFSEAIAETKKFSQEFARLGQERGEYIKSQIKSKIDELLKNHRELRKKIRGGAKLNVLMSMGVYHTEFYHDFKKAGGNIEWRFGGTSPLVFPYALEAQRRPYFNKEISDELAAKSLVEDELWPVVGALSADTEKIARISRKIISRLTFEDIKQISSYLASGKDILKAIEALGKDIKIPSSEEEIDKMLERK